MTTQAPQHIAFIMDGNGRWATRRGLGRLRGHAAGVETFKTMCAECLKRGIPYATFYAFSTENWKRPQDEVSGLFGLMRTFFENELKATIDQGICVRFLGDTTEDSQLSPDTLALVREVEAATRHNTKLVVNIALNYSGRDEIVRAATYLARQGAPITPETFAAALDTAGIPDPDILIRTGGEQRLSNFLLWQLSYTELYFSPLAWPDFDATALHEALSSFTGRQRRFGGLPSETSPTLVSA